MQNEAIQTRGREEPGPTEQGSGQPGISEFAINAVQPLWTTKEAAAFLRKSVRWVFYALRLPESEPGSIPHVRVGRAPRFSPEVLSEWVNVGCPPASVFRTWKAGSRHRKA
jgi:hypothetical protein